MGVVVALFIVLSDVVKPLRRPDEWFCSQSATDAEGASTALNVPLHLPTWISALFFLWFVFVFIHLVSRALPRKEEDALHGTRPPGFDMPVLDLLHDSVAIVAQGGRDLVETYV